MLTRLPVQSRAAAIALATLGHQISPKAYRNDRTGDLAVRWFCDSDVPAAQKLLDQAGHADPAKSLRTLHPEHPYLVCLYYQEAVLALRAWLTRSWQAVPAILPASRNSRLLRVIPAPTDALLRENLMRHMPAAGTPGYASTCSIADPIHAAAAIVCGFVPADTLTENGRFLFAGNSLTFAGLSLLHLQAIRDPGMHILDDLSTYARGEHPACYALQCAANLRHFDEAERLVMKNPVHMLRGDGTRSALMSEALISAPDSRHRDRLRLHLAGMTP